MRYLVVLAALVAALAASATANAGGWATVGFAPLPDGTAAGETWTPKITVLQHGQTPLAGVTPIVRIRDDGGKVVKSFTATPTGKTGVYHAVVKFPGEGTYSYEVYDGFTQYGGQKTHTFGTISVGGGGGSDSTFPLVPSIGGLARGYTRRSRAYSMSSSEG